MTPDDEPIDESAALQEGFPAEDGTGLKAEQPIVDNITSDHGAEPSRRGAIGRNETGIHIDKEVFADIQRELRADQEARKEAGLEAPVERDLWPGLGIGGTRPNKKSQYGGLLSDMERARDATAHIRMPKAPDFSAPFRKMEEESRRTMAELNAELDRSSNEIAERRARERAEDIARDERVAAAVESQFEALSTMATLAVDENKTSTTRYIVNIVLTGLVLTAAIATLVVAIIALTRDSSKTAPAPVAPTTTIQVPSVGVTTPSGAT
jgi:hypothetical protein